MAERIWNKDQLLAITSTDGNMLVSAAAGSGKTAVLVERVIRLLTDEHHPVDADRLLIVTFTKLAAAEMKEKINKALSAKIAENPRDTRLQRQRLLMERAHIGTIHSFCADIIRENFSAVGLPPDSRVIEEDEAKDIAASALEEAIEKYYSEGGETFAELAETLGGGRSDSGLSEAVLTLYNFIRALPHYEDWLFEKAAMYDPSVPVGDTVWGKILFERAKSVLIHGLENAERMLGLSTDESCDKYAAMFSDDMGVLRRLIERCEEKNWDEFGRSLCNPDFMRKPVVKDAGEMLKARAKAVRDSYQKDIKDLAAEFSPTEAQFREDIADLYPKISCLFGAALYFDKLYSEMKREKRVLDFSDLEQFSLSVLTEKDENGNYVPSAAAKAAAEKFEYILIDECQDNNKVQDTIFKMISRGDNLFFVGDVKQSIYRFRQAMPELFLEKRRSWPVFDGITYPATVILGCNYRSRKNIAGAVNFIFEQIMSEKAAEMDYTAEEKLIPAAVYPESDMIRNELLLVDANEDSTKSEAAAVAEHIYNMVLRGDPVTDNGTLRPVRYSDICILLRSFSSQSGAFISALRKRGIACVSMKENGFLSRPEIAAVINVLKAVDNPLLDLPLAGAMLSEMFLFTPDDLAKMRFEDKKVPLYTSVKTAAEKGDEKAAEFINTLDTLRRAAAYETSDALIERLYDLTLFPQIMRSCDDGENRLANLRLLIKYAADREKNGSHGLSAFLRFINRLEERESDLNPAGNTSSGGDAVRIMTVHGSKGLEFPVVYLSGTGKKFNFDNRLDKPLLHPELGFACARRHPETGTRFSTIPQLALKHELRRLSLAEEMRILYVAITRPKENLIISCCQKDWDKYLEKLGTEADFGEKPDPYFVSSAGTFSDWIVTALLRHPDAVDLRMKACIGENSVIPDDTRWKFTFTDADIDEEFEAEEEETEKAEPDKEVLEMLNEREKWVYPFAASEKIPVKAGVSSLTHQEMHKKMLFAAKPQNGALSGADRGTALHTFMQFCDFELAKADPKAEIKRLSEKRFITEKQAEVIDPQKVKAFFESGLFRRIENSPKVWRELRFLQGLSAKSLGYEGASDEDKITVQGVADCVFEESGKLIVVDYKTDYVDDIEELRERYAAQLNMYKELLTKTMGKEVVSAIIWSFRFGKELEV
ncbi:MAG: helicase-exonuclease AddAB subunit AddA [Oscillospiraceae bacterium]|nr:helicase-exonuclease AddAB subunit AddA [Oscillospiraceae bacterium]